MKRYSIVLIVLILSMQVFAESYMELARHARKNNNYLVVIELTTQQISAQPKDVEAYVYRSEAYAAMQEYGKALKDANKILACWSKKCKIITLAEAYAIRANLYEHVDDFPKASEDYNMAVKKDAKNIKSYINRAEFYYRSQQFENAEEDFRSALVMKEDDSTLKIAIARCLLAQSKYDDAFLILNTLSKLEPRNDEARRLLALVYLYKEEITTFVDQYILYLGMVNNGDFAPLSYAATKEYNYTIRAITRVLNNSNDKAFWLSLRARIECESKNYDEAIEDLKRVETIYGDSVEDPFVYYLMASSYAGLYDYSMSLKYHNLLLEFEERIGKQNPFDYINRADAYLNNNEIKKALADCDKALELATEGLSYIYCARGWIYDLSRNYEMALDNYNKAVKANDGLSSMTYLMRGKCFLLHKNDSVRANADFEMVLQMDTILSTESNRHYALMYLERNEEAILWMDSLLTSESENAGIHYDAACLYSRMNEGEKAVAFLKRAFELGYRNLNHIAQDNDMDAIRNRNDFIELLNKYKLEKVESLFNKLS